MPLRQVRCQICNKRRTYGKYRRRLDIHRRSGEITNNQIDLVIFQTKLTRSDKLLKTNTVIHGRRCNICGSHYLNLLNHLQMKHRQNNIRTLENIYNKSVPNEKMQHYNFSIEFNHNPLHTYTGNAQLDHKLISRYESELVSDESSLTSCINASNNDVFYYSSDEIHDDKDVTNPADVFNSNNLKTISKELLTSILDFKLHLSTIWGGDKSHRANSMSMSNIYLLLNNFSCTESFSYKRI